MTRIPLRNDDYFTPNDLDISIWEAAYPLIDVRQMLLEIAAWNHSRPRNRKTRRGVRKHIDSWLALNNEKSALRLERDAKKGIDAHQWGQQALRVD